MSEDLGTDQVRLLVDRASGHDPDAWELLYRNSHPRLVSFARRRLATDRSAEDAVSETFVRAIQNIERFNWTGGGFDAWLYGILKNVILEQHRQTGRDLRLEQRQAGSMTSSFAGGVADQVLVLEERSAVRRAFESLDEADREVLELRVVGELSADDVGAVLGKKPGAVRMAQSRALGRLRAAMERVGDV